MCVCVYIYSSSEGLSDRLRQSKNFTSEFHIIFQYSSTNYLIIVHLVIPGTLITFPIVFVSSAYSCI